MIKFKQLTIENKLKEKVDYKRKHKVFVECVNNFVKYHGRYGVERLITRTLAELEVAYRELEDLYLENNFRGIDEGGADIIKYLLWEAKVNSQLFEIDVLKTVFYKYEKLV